MSCKHMDIEKIVILKEDHKMKDIHNILRKRAAAGLAAFGLCSAMLLTQANMPNPVWAEEAGAESSDGQGTEAADTAEQGTETEDNATGQDTSTEQGETAGQDTSTEQGETAGQDTSTEQGETAGQDTSTEQGETTEQGEASVAKAQKISLKVSKKSYTADQFKASKQSFQIGASAKTKVSYKVTKGNKYVSVNGKGIVTVKRWTPQGTYKVTVTAKATDKYKKAEKNVTIQVKAPKNAALSKINMSWDLKNYKTVPYSTAYGAYDYEIGDYIKLMKTGSIKLKNLKKTKVSNGTRYQVAYTLQYTHPTDFSQTEIDQIINFGGESEGVWGSPCYMAAVDYQTGENLTLENAYGVTVKADGWKRTGENRHNGSTDGWFSENAVSEIAVKITYPIGYQDLCILAGGLAERTEHVGNEDFVFAKKNFKSASGELYGEDANICHGIRMN